MPTVSVFLPSSGIAVGSLTAAVDTATGSVIFQAFFTWLTAVLAIFWVGGWIFQTVILSPADTGADPDLRATAYAAGRRFELVAPYALVGFLVANVGLLLAQSITMAGGRLETVSPLLVSRVLFSSRFGLAWWLREFIAAIALAVTLSAARREDSMVNPAFGMPPAVESSSPLRDWRRELPEAFRRLPQLPGRMVDNVRRQDSSARTLFLLSLALLVTFTLTSQNGSSSASVYAAIADLLYFLCESIWLGGLFYVALVLLPASAALSPQQRARVVAGGLPEFSALASIAVLLLIVSGLLNMTFQPIAWTEFLTTTYGRTLAVMIELFLILVGMSVYHSFFLRPRLVRELGLQTDLTGPVSPGLSAVSLTGQSMLLRGQRGGSLSSQAPEGAASGRPMPTGESGSDRQSRRARQELPPRARDLEERLRDWLRREALLAGALLLAVVLLGIFAVSLLPNLTVGSSGSRSGQTSTPFSGTKTVDTYNVTLHVSPNVFGTNTFTVTLKDADGKPVTGAGVLILVNSLDMDMGTESQHLKEIGSTAPGSYSGQTQLTMAGHWQITVQAQVRSGAKLTVNFDLTATY
jgi:putative copper export protein